MNRDPLAHRYKSPEFVKVSGFSPSPKERKISKSDINLKMITRAQKGTTKPIGTYPVSVKKLKSHHSHFLKSLDLFKPLRFELDITFSKLFGGEFN
jgi:hypothetical protein